MQPKQTTAAPQALTIPAPGETMDIAISVKGGTADAAVDEMMETLTTARGVYRERGAVLTPRGMSVIPGAERSLVYMHCSVERQAAEAQPPPPTPGGDATEPDNGAYAAARLYQAIGKDLAALREELQSHLLDHYADPNDPATRDQAWFESLAKAVKAQHELIGELNKHLLRGA